MHFKRPWYFASENLKLDFQMKFWSHVFKTYLGRNRHVVLQRRDTMSDTCKKVELRFKLDLRLLVFKENDTIADGATGEVARKATTGRKFYLDSLKSVITLKCHLDVFLQSILNIPEEEIVKVQFPLIQAMGLEVQVSSLRFLRKKIYITNEDLYSFNFPRTLSHIKGGQLENLINSLTLIIEKMVGNLERKYNDGQSEEDSARQEE